MKNKKDLLSVIIGILLGFIISLGLLNGFNYKMVPYLIGAVIGIILVLLYLKIKKK